MFVLISIASAELSVALQHYLGINTRIWVAADASRENVNMLLEEILQASLKIAEHGPLALLAFAVIALVLILAAILRWGLASAPPPLRVVVAVTVAAVFLFIVFKVMSSFSEHSKENSQLRLTESS
jgi:hypothetical protein